MLPRPAAGVHQRRRGTRTPLITTARGRTSILPVASTGPDLIAPSQVGATFTTGERLPKGGSSTVSGRTSSRWWSSGSPGTKQAGAVLHADAQRNRHALACECGPLGPTRRRGRGHPQHVDDTMVTRRRSISSGSRTHSPSSGPQSAPATTSDSRRSPITPPSPWDPPPAGSPLPGRDRDRPRPTPPPRRPHGRWGHGTP